MALKSWNAKKIAILAGYAAAAAVLFSAPMFISDFRLNLLAKFLAFAIVALGLDLIWGYTGILSLGHGIFFGLGAYAMAMYLKLESTHGKLPDFMGWSGLKELPLFWRPFESFPFALAMGILIPALLALALGYFTFRNRIRGVYFTILTQALVIITTTLIVGQQAVTGGTNGVTGYTTILGYSLGSPDTKRVLYWITAAVMLGIFVLCRYITASRFGKVLRAIRDGENRVRFIGYNPAMYQMVIFTISAGIAGLAGMLFVLHVGIISPSMLGIVPSIEMVLWVAIGGRGTLIGAALGAVAMNWAKSEFSTAYPEGWLFFMGGLFVVVVVFLPKGIAGLFHIRKEKLRRFMPAFLSQRGKLVSPKEGDGSLKQG
ncbi:urea ABC transporter permease subunit UrtC [Paenibacillus sp. HB172176]|uniref:urea ABC transporter permease subunit UrtC n=1 Tax=Paenibacillus sp. HB172176 TaxID=2493690 RepID=UPI00143998CB|nr:urea ABC transporter permease subunit UrtC [Paenibacillus sp. HB172176]